MVPINSHRFMPHVCKHFLQGKVLKVATVVGMQRLGKNCNFHGSYLLITFLIISKPFCPTAFLSMCLALPSESTSSCCIMRNASLSSSLSVNTSNNIGLSV